MIFALQAINFQYSRFSPALQQHSLEIYTSELKEILDTLTEMSVKWEAVPMLARTHGQPATPTRMGKELHVFVDRIKGQLKLLEQVHHYLLHLIIVPTFHFHLKDTTTLRYCCLLL